MVGTGSTLPCRWGWNSELPDGSMWLAFTDPQAGSGSRSLTARTNVTCVQRLSATRRWVIRSSGRKCSCGEYTETAACCAYVRMFGNSTASPRRMRPSGHTSGGRRGVSSSTRSPQNGHPARVSSATAARSKSWGGISWTAAVRIREEWPVSGSHRTSTSVGTGSFAPGGIVAPTRRRERSSILSSR